jgi:hypothetical protein
MKADKSLIVGDAIAKIERVFRGPGNGSEIVITTRSGAIIRLVPNEFQDIDILVDEIELAL